MNCMQVQQSQQIIHCILYYIIASVAINGDFILNSLHWLTDFLRNIKIERMETFSIMQQYYFKKLRWNNTNLSPFNFLIKRTTNLRKSLFSMLENWYLLQIYSFYTMTDVLWPKTNSDFTISEKYDPIN